MTLLALAAPIAALVAPNGALMKQRRSVSVAVESAESAEAPEAPVETRWPMVKSVSETMRAFEANYPRTIISIWRSPINDMLQVTHLSLVDKRFVPDAVFAFGYLAYFNLLLDKYPVPGEQDKLIDASILALDLDPAQIRADAAEVATWLEGKTEAEILAVAGAAQGKVSDAFASTIASKDYLHTRSVNVGVLMMMDKVGVKADSEALTRWTAPLGLRKRNVEKDAMLVKDLKEKLSQAMQMLKAMEIREKKRMAESLEAKAKEAQAKAAAAGAK